ncbi:P-loop containing nucleoside triphosphate hydrolase protein [Aaosphaeria arxii CBS 175.79]|uniref:P-loop containing nucleoside triphosphate hydrolase protein n=1 Tax=Aaosphaeria arxii CBS 175.79 TaxID=1450172 RepID=A0A6A5XS75_9PLEO|nr:P-loop containing nucleoside triphosphate hydrolase protein [Aaosphaeria arxii CBS 175.79]KAF2015746.1 P-loop containing nucleoside triphosphate hydrolase protein [Aaosphaeria arxii CBS 175.79]
MTIDTLSCQNLIQSCKVTGHSDLDSSAVNHTLSNNNVEVAVYNLHTVEDHVETPDDDSDSASSFSILPLPYLDFDGCWEGLVFDEPLPEQLFRIITRMMHIIHKTDLRSSTITWLNLVLLYGAPGTGKTTLAKALAQKLSIRMAHIYPKARFLEINCHILLSRWFGESSKLVGKLFENIRLHSDDPSTLVVVSIDEVETLAGSREKAASGTECHENLRSTNELLRGLDKLYNRPNVVIICTSNLKDVLDDAFVDRCRIKKHLDSPNVDCIYNILRSAINELIKLGLVVYDVTELNAATKNSTQAEQGTPKFMPVSLSPLSAHNSLHKEDRSYVPDLDWVIGNLSHLTYDDQPETAPILLRRIAQSAMGLSSRTLRTLPIAALAEYTVAEPCDFRQLLGALERKLAEERGT